ncbi:MAG: 4Fe-4S binding protein [Bacillota bacterium]|jgi:2-oxoglutarate ferredoxin oxidoreductase subunit delta
MKEFKSIVNESGKGKFYLFTELCKGCGLCIEKCPKHDIGWTDRLGIYGAPTVESGRGEEGCIACKTCQNICPECAILIEKIQ